MKLRTEGVTWQEIDGDLVILDLVRSVYLTTNGSGAFLTKRLREEQTSEALIEALRTEFDLSPERASADVEAFVASLREKRLLV